MKSIVRLLNPQMKNLIDMEGSATVIRGEVLQNGAPGQDPEKYRKLVHISSDLPSEPDEFLDHPDQENMTFSIPDETPYRKDPGAEEIIIGDYVPILFETGDAFELSRLFVFSDGMCRIGSAGELFPVSDLPLLYERGQSATLRQPEARSGFLGSGNSKHRTIRDVSVPDRIKEIHDRLNVFNGKESLSIICNKLLESYLQKPTTEAKAALSEAYEAVPTDGFFVIEGSNKSIQSLLYGTGEAEAVP